MIQNVSTMGRVVKRGALSSRWEDSTNNIIDALSSEDDSDKGHEECVIQNEKSDGRYNHSCNGPLGPQSVQGLDRIDQNGCIAAELNFAEGSSSFFFLIAS
jgi:hypothetical protein